MKMYRFLTIIVSLLCLPTIFLYSQAMKPENDIKPLRSAAPEGIGPMSLNYLRQNPIAAVFVFDGVYPDLFISGNSGSKKEGLYLFKWLKNNEEETPIFESPIKIDGSFGLNGTIFQAEDRKIHALWLEGKKIHHTIFDKQKLKFILKNSFSISGIPGNPRSITAFHQKGESYEIVLEVNGLSIPPKYKNQNPSTEEWRPYDAAGVSTLGLRYTYLYAAHIPDLNTGKPENIRQISESNKEVYYGMRQMTPALLDGKQYLITGSGRGMFPCYEVMNSLQGWSIGKQRFIAGEDGNMLYHPSIGPAVCAYGNSGAGYSNLIASGEGAIYFYRFTGKFTGTGAPVYKDPVPVLETNAVLDAGSLPTPAVCDWDGDGLEDLIVGNSEGFILFYKNIGTRENPRFLPEQRIQAAGKDIHIQAGYAGSVQGAQESRWGYVSPTVVDWNEDGLPDLILGDITGCYTIYLNKGTRTQPQLEAPHPLFCEGLNLHGMWRCRAATAKFGGRLALATIDDDDHFHIYWKIDDYNVEDGGKILLNDGSVILTSADPAGGTGRCKLDFFDYDQDGKLDLIIGTGRRSAIPNMETGYPLPVLGKKTLGTPLFMKNTGTEDQPVFAHPQPFHHTAAGIVQPGGSHETGAAGTWLGGGKSPNIIVANEEGRLFLLHGDYLRLMSIKEASRYKDVKNNFPE